MLRTWLVPVLPAIRHSGATMRDLAAVPWLPFITASMPPRAIFRLASASPSSGNSATGTGVPFTARTSRGSTARPVATRAVMIANCKGEAST